MPTAAGGPGGLGLLDVVVQPEDEAVEEVVLTSPQHFCIIELGSGTGICGMTAAALGGRVIATDLAECLPILSINEAQNAVTITNTVAA